jgi:hypothetical protein
VRDKSGIGWVEGGGAREESIARGLKPDLWWPFNVRTEVRTYLRSNDNGKGKSCRGKGVRSPTIARSGGLRMGHPGGWGCGEKNSQQHKQEQATANTGVLRCAQNDEVSWGCGGERATARATADPCGMTNQRTGNDKNRQRQKQIPGFFPFGFAQGQNDKRLAICCRGLGPLRRWGLLWGCLGGRLGGRGRGGGGRRLAG